MPTPATIATLKAYTQCALAQGLSSEQATASAYLGLTLDWFKTKCLAWEMTEDQVGLYRALPAWQQHEAACQSLVDAGDIDGTKAACHAWMAWAQQHMFNNTVPVGA